MSDSRQPISKGLSPMVTMEIMAAVATIFFVAFVLLFFFYLRSKRYSSEADSTAIVSSLADQDIGIPRGLSPEVIKALPITIFRPDDFKEPLECSVCISELAEGEEVRMLPICSHWFHVECIDMWLHSNSTCPLCRSPVCSEPPESSGIHVVDVRPVEEITGDGVSAESINLPSNVLFWGSGGRVGSSSSAGPLAVKMEGTLVIEMPRGAGEALTSPTLARLRSLRSLLSPTTS